MAKRKTFMGNLWGTDKEGSLPLVTKDLMGDGVKCGNVWRERR